MLTQSDGKPSAGFRVGRCRQKKHGNLRHSAPHGIFPRLILHSSSLPFMVKIAGEGHHGVQGEQEGGERSLKRGPRETRCGGEFLHGAVPGSPNDRPMEHDD